MLYGPLWTGTRELISAKVHYVGQQHPAIFFLSLDTRPRDGQDQYIEWGLPGC